MSHHRHCTSHKSWSTVYNYGLCPFFFFLLRVVWPLHILQKMTKCTISTFVPKYSFYLHFCSKILILWHFIPMFSETHHQNCSALSPRNLLQNHLDRGKKKKEKKRKNELNQQYWEIQAGLSTPSTFAWHHFSPLAAFTSGVYFLHSERQWQWFCKFYTAKF